MLERRNLMDLNPLSRAPFFNLNFWMRALHFSSSLGLDNYIADPEHCSCLRSLNENDDFGGCDLRYNRNGKKGPSHAVPWQLHKKFGFYFKCIKKSLKAGVPQGSDITFAFRIFPLAVARQRLTISFINKVLLEHNHIHSFIYCLCLLSHYNGTAE